MLLHFLLLSVVSARLLRVGAGADYTSLATAVDAAASGDVLELVDYNYDLTQTLVISRPLTIRTNDGAPRAVLRSTSFDVDVLIAVGANNVELRNLVFGRSANDRAIDIFVSAGTQSKTSSLFGDSIDIYNGDNEESQQRSVSSLLIDNTNNNNNDDNANDANRAIRGFVLHNIDFSASVSATNVAFDTGAYIGVSIAHCVFGTRDFTDAIVAVGGSRFADSAPLQFNAFDKAQLALKGTGLELGTNYWSNTGVPRPALSLTYCIDRSCTMLGPVVDNDAPAARAFATVADALNAGVQNVLITAAEVELGVLNGAVAQAGTTLRGRRTQSAPDVAENCEPDAAVTMVHLRGASPLESLGTALSYIVDVRFEMHDGLSIALAYYDGSLSGDVLLERVSFLGCCENQTALLLSSKTTSLTLSNVVMMNMGTGVDLRAGALVVTDSQFLINRHASIAVGGTGIGTGLRVSGSLFAAAPDGSIVFGAGVKSALMLPISITCTQFLNALFVEPSDCSSNAQQCANALRHNTFLEVVDPQRVAPNRRFLMHGGNHIERIPRQAINDYLKFENNGQQGHSFQFADKQGRFGRVRADIALLNHARSEFVLAAHVPMRQECFAESVPGQRVVSGMFSLTTDAPRRCISLALQFTVVVDPKDNTTASASDDVSIYDVAHLGNSVRGAAVWQRAASHAVVHGVVGGITVEASSGAGALLRAVVVAQQLTDTERASLLAAGTSEQGTVRARQHYCVACGSDRLPAYIVDERCGGGSDATRIGDDFDAVFDAALATGLGDSVSLLVYGTQCVTRRCTLRITSMEFTLEGFSVSQQGSLARPSRCAADEPLLTMAAPRTTLRYLTLTTEKPSVSTAIPLCAVDISQDGARVSFCTINGGVCARESGAQIIGNEIAGATSAPAVLVARSARDTLVQANSLSGGAVSVARGAATTRVDRNTFGAQSGVENAGYVLMTGNTFLPRPLDTGAPCIDTPVTASDVSLTSTGDNYGTNCRLTITNASKLRIAGTRSAAPWVDVLLEMSGVVDARIANVDLRGANTQIVLHNEDLTTLKSSIVLYDVGLDLSASALADTLVGGASTRSACAAEHEPHLGGFSLTQSLVVDASTRRVLLVGAAAAAAKLKTTEFLDASTGDVQKCSAVPDAPFCRCLAALPTVPPPSTKTTAETTAEQQPLAVHVAGDLDEEIKEKAVAEEELAEEEQEEDSFIGETWAAIVAQVTAAPKKVKNNNNHDNDHSDHHHSNTWFWILLAVVGLLVIIGAAIGICLCLRSSNSPTIVVEQGGSAESSSSEPSPPSGGPVLSTHRRKKTSRTTQSGNFGVDISGVSSAAASTSRNELTLRHKTKRTGEVEDY
jgi:hypothetical protein